MERPVRNTEKTSNKRAIGFVVVVIVHALMFWALTSGLAKTMVDALMEPLETRVIEEAQQIPEAPPPPPPKFDTPPPVVMDMPDIVITQTAPTQTITTTKKVAAPPPPPPPAADVLIPPRTNPRRPNAGAEEIYPAMSKRLGEEGTVVLLLTVNDDGRVTEARVDETSGFDRLDAAASREAVRSWRFLPGTRNGKPETMQLRIKVTFSLKG